MHHQITRRVRSPSPPPRAPSRCRPFSCCLRDTIKTSHNKKSSLPLPVQSALGTCRMPRDCRQKARCSSAALCVFCNILTRVPNAANSQFGNTEMPLRDGVLPRTPFNGFSYSCTVPLLRAQGGDRARARAVMFINVCAHASARSKKKELRVYENVKT